MKYDKDLGISYEELERKFRTFLDENKCWSRADKEVIKIFKLEFKKDIRTFQRWRKNLLLSIRMFEDSNHKYRQIINNNICYFCETTEELIIHHLNKNRKNNTPQNLLTLCPKCHHRLHKICDKITTDRTTLRQKYRADNLKQLKGGKE